MRVLDPGHCYGLTVFDRRDDYDVPETILRFMKRVGAGYPGNTDSNPGTNCQEVLRALIQRVRYLDLQVPCKNNGRILQHLRAALFEFEERAAFRHGRALLLGPLLEIESEPFCANCGHIGCGDTCVSPATRVHGT